jgi:hypothetical protein
MVHLPVMLNSKAVFPFAKSVPSIAVRAAY